MFHKAAAAVMLVASLAAAQSPASAPASQPDAPAPGVLRVVCFGDSITGNRPGEQYQDKYIKFADLLQMLLEARLGEGRAEVINSGWAGDCTYPKPGQGFPGAVARARADVLDHHPQIAIVLIGGNDKIETDADTARTRENLLKIAASLKAEGLRVLMLQYPNPLPAPQNAAKGWTQLAAKDPIIADVARQAGVELLDLRPAMAEAAARYPRAQLANPVDGVHLAPRGEIIYAKAIYRKLEQLGWVAPPQ